MLHLEAIKHTVPLLSTHDSACAVKGDPHFSLTLSWWVPEWSRSLPRFYNSHSSEEFMTIRQNYHLVLSFHLLMKMHRKQHHELN